MNAAERLGLQHRVCDRKVKMGRKAAMKVADEARRQGTPLAAYRCPFLDADGESHWHIGHAPTMRTLERTAELLRERHNANVPCTPDTNKLESRSR